MRNVARSDQISSIDAGDRDNLPSSLNPDRVPAVSRSHPLTTIFQHRRI
jgi:hypothetical protein